VFEDIPVALGKLRLAGWNLAVLTNCDEDLFAQTQRQFTHAFDLVVTAERVQAYKPLHAHFRYFEQATGVRRRDWVHVGCSWFHDIAVAQQLGLKYVWLDREGEGEKQPTTSSRLVTATELPAAIIQLSERGG
jgi:2-haloacid dehalogenase